MLIVDDGSLVFNGWEKVIYRGKEFDAPVDISVLLAYDYLLELIISKEIFESE